MKCTVSFGVCNHGLEKYSKSLVSSECFEVHSCLLVAIQTNKKYIQTLVLLRTLAQVHRGWIIPKISAAHSFLHNILQSEVGVLVVINVVFLFVQITIKGIHSFF